MRIAPRLSPKDPARHIVLTTATPHSGIEESFRSLLGLLRMPSSTSEEGADVPRRQVELRTSSSGAESDLVHWLGEDTPFPDP